MRNTFNISTAAAFIAAGRRAGGRQARQPGDVGPVGGADVLEALGVRIDLAPEQVAACLEEVGIGFLFAPVFHPAMRHVAGPRREIGVRTIFNLLGPLTNPAGAKAQLLGRLRAASGSSRWRMRWGVWAAAAPGGARRRRARRAVADRPSRLPSCATAPCTPIASTRSSVGCGAAPPADLAGGDAAQQRADHPRASSPASGTAAQMDIALLNAAAVLYVGGAAPTTSPPRCRWRAPRWTTAPRPASSRL